MSLEMALISLDSDSAISARILILKLDHVSVELFVGEGDPRREQ